MRVKCRSDGVIVPVRSWSGVNEVPVSSPTGARLGSTNGDRVPTADVGAPGAFVGSAGPTGGAEGRAAVVCFCCAPAGMPARIAPPAAAAAPASSDRRVMPDSAGGDDDESLMRVLRLL